MVEKYGTIYAGKCTREAELIEIAKQEAETLEVSKLVLHCPAAGQVVHVDVEDVTYLTPWRGGDDLRDLYLVEQTGSK